MLCCLILKLANMILFIYPKVTSSNYFTILGETDNFENNIGQ